MDLLHTAAHSARTIQCSESPPQALSEVKRPTEAEIIEVALQKSPKERRRLMPKHFDNSGRARPRRLDVKIGEIRRRNREGNKSISTVPYGTEQNPQKSRDAIGHSNNVDKPRQSEYEDLPPGCEQCSFSNRKCDLLGSHACIGEACGACLRKGEQCSLSTFAGGPRKTLRTGIKRKQPDSRSAQEAKHIKKVARTTSLRPHSSTLKNIVQSDPEDKDSGSNEQHEDSTPTTQILSTNLYPNQDSRKQIDSVASHHRETYDLIESPHETSQYPTFHTANAEPQHTRINLISSTHQRASRQVSNNPTSRSSSSYSFANPGHRPDDILCYGNPCSKKWFDSEYLEKYCGISLLDARKSHEQYGSWLCPQCSERNKRVSGDFLDMQALSIDSKRGHEVLSDEAIQGALNRFSRYFLQYIDTASTDKLVSNVAIPFLQIPCIRDETSDQPANVLIDVLRGMLGTQSGVLIKDKIFSLHLQDVKTSIWIEGILGFLLGEFIFKAASPFEDFSLPDMVLSEIFSSEIAAVIKQDIRIRTARENSTRFSDCLKSRLDKQVRLLNGAMAPLVGGSDSLHSLHTTIAKIAEDMNTKFNAYTGTFKPIRPHAGDKFNPGLHTSKASNEGENTSGRLIQFATVVGVKFRLAGYRDWRICAKAEVQLYPEPEN